MSAPINATDTVEHFIAAYNRRDVERAIALLDEQVVLMPMLAHMRPDVRPYEGYAGARSFFAEVAALPVAMALVPSQITAEGDRVTVMATIRTSTAGGLVDHPVSIVVCLRDGRIRLVQSFGSVETARSAWEQV